MNIIKILSLSIFSFILSTDPIEYEEPRIFFFSEEQGKQQTDNESLQNLFKTQIEEIKCTETCEKKREIKIAKIVLEAHQKGIELEEDASPVYYIRQVM